ncbi:hypothetical protein AAFC00_000619 [Neodothiora populina]|uniref:SCD domain-containing protein n=1 Tax=Neodothiora populina TaxID=2781224 RepID=A0ABR3PDG5_9PEZI
MSSDLSEPEVDMATSEPSTNKRRSGRVSRKPAVFAAPPSTSSKRKRDEAEEAATASGQDHGVEDGEDIDDSSESDGEPDEEELRERKARARRTKATKKPTAKRPKTNGTAVALPVRGQQKLAPSRQKAKPRAKASALDADEAEKVGGLYAEVFARGHTLHSVASEWLKSFEHHESQAVADLINFVLKSAGCDLKVSNHDIEDPDNCTGRLEDLQGEFQAHDISDYPIIAKGKGTVAFRDTVTGFFQALIRAIHSSGLLFSSLELIENVHIWLSAMSAAQNRPFRHTATVVSLAIITSLCEVGTELAEAAAASLRHSETQGKQKKVNKGRVSDLKKGAKLAKDNQETLDTIIKDWFDTIYIHRYRDVDPHIRVDCARAMGDWIMTYPDVFFDGSHLRYLGWVLSDPNHSTRLEVVKQLQRFYRDTDKVSGLKTFTERFRGRIVEMATRDAEANVRAAAVELLDLLREGGLLEPDDIDAIGRLIFDAEPRVRKAVVGFFAESIKDAYEAKIEDFGGLESVEEVLGEASETFDQPCIEWIKLKCLVQGLEAYDSVDGDMSSHIEHVGQDNYLLHADAIESRFMVAADTLFDHLDEVREWEAVAGYLLYDVSGEGTDSATVDTEEQIKQELRLSEQEEVILLEVLNSSVKCTIARLLESASDKKGKKTKRQREDVDSIQERTARHLANLVPRLLKKYGESPQTATTILRLERVVNLEDFQEFHQDPASYAALLDDINKQFMTHGNEEVLTEASRTLLRARSYHELGDTTEEKIEALWEDTIDTFAKIAGKKNLASRGSMSNAVLEAISKTILRLEKLSSISKPIDHLEAPQASQSKGASKGPEPQRSIDMLISLINRAVPNPGRRESAEMAALEDSLAMHASRTVMFYLMWRIPALVESLKSPGSSQAEELDALAARRDAYVDALTGVLRARSINDGLACVVAGQILDTHVIMATLRRVPPNQRENDDFLALALDIDVSTRKRTLRIYGAAETSFAKLADKSIDTTAEEETEDGDVDDEPVDPIDRDPEDEDDVDPSDDDEGLSDGAAAQASQARRSQKLQKSLMAEQRLCELAAKIVLAVLGGVMDDESVRKRLLRNKTRLGPNLKEVLAHLDVDDTGKKTKGRKAVAGTTNNAPNQSGAATAATTAAAQKTKSSEFVNDQDSDDEEDEEEQREREIQEEEMADQGGDDEEEENDAQLAAADEASEAAHSVLGD